MIARTDFGEKTASRDTRRARRAQGKEEIRATKSTGKAGL